MTNPSSSNWKDHVFNLCCCTGSSSDIIEDDFEYLLSPDKDGQQYNHLFSRESSEIESSPAVKVELSNNQPGTNNTIENSNRNSGRNEATMMCTGDDLFFCNLLCDGTWVSDNDYSPITPLPEEIYSYNSDLQHQVSHDNLTNPMSYDAGNDLNFTLPPKQNLPNTYDNVKAERVVEQAHPRDHTHIDGNANYTDPTTAMSSQTSYRNGTRDFSMIIDPSYSSSHETVPLGSNNVYIEDSRPGSAGSHHTQHSTQYMPVENTEIDDIDKVDVDWLITVLSEETGGQGIQKRPSVEASYDQRNRTEPIPIKCQTQGHLSDDAVSVSMSDMSTSPEIRGKSGKGFLMSAPIRPSDAVVMSSTSTKISNTPVKRRRTVADTDKTNELNNKLVRAVHALKQLKNMTKTFVQEVLPNMICIYLSGTATIDMVRPIFSLDSIMTVPCQSNLALRVGCNVNEIISGEFIGHSNIVYGSKQLREIILRLIAFRLNGFPRDAAINFGAEVVEARRAVVSANGDKMCADFIWRSAGLIALGFPSELAVPGLATCVQNKGVVVKAVLSFDSESVLRQLGLSTVEHELRF